MKQKTLWLLSGPPASGKSTWARSRIKTSHDIWISRDIIRFAYLKENDDYFKYEKQVVKDFLNSVKAAINDFTIDNIYVDATHLTNKSRNKIINLIENNNCNVINVLFPISLDDCLSRNEKREGREKVPESSIINMYISFEMPDNSYDTIFIVDGKEVSADEYLG